MSRRRARARQADGRPFSIHSRVNTAIGRPLYTDGEWRGTIRVSSAKTLDDDLALEGLGVAVGALDQVRPLTRWPTNRPSRSGTSSGRSPDAPGRLRPPARGGGDVKQRVGEAEVGEHAPLGDEPREVRHLFPIELRVVTNEFGELGHRREVCPISDLPWSHELARPRAAGDFHHVGGVDAEDWARSFPSSSR